MGGGPDLVLLEGLDDGADLHVAVASDLLAVVSLVGVGDAGDGGLPGSHGGEEVLLGGNIITVKK